MPIPVTCVHCKASLRVADHWAGKRGKCPHCQAAIDVPAANAPIELSEADVVEDEAAPQAAASPQAAAAGNAGERPSPTGKTGTDPHPGVPVVAPLPSLPTNPAVSQAQVRRPISQSGAAQPAGAVAKSPQKPSPNAAGPAASAPQGSASSASRPVLQPRVQATPQPPAPVAKTPQKAQAAPAAPSHVLTVSEILAAFQSPIEPVKSSTTYKLGIFLVTLVMLLLPLIYIALIGAVCYLLYLHGANDTGLLTMGRGRGRAFAVLLYFGPLLAGAILILFMIKPLFARSAKDFKKRSLTPDREPALFAFVERVCLAVGATVPRRIDVDCEVNASAGFRRGVWSMFGNDMVLTIGLPLVAGLNLRQFAGVLAHEFGHFSQGAGMRLTFLIRSISWWLTRAVYERDVWDDRLLGWAQIDSNFLGLIFHLARLFVWLTRRVLWLLMVIGHTVAGFMLRQMEFDADRYETRLAGSEAFEATARQLPLLGAANQGAQADLAQFFRDGRLGDNLPRLIMVNLARIPADIRVKINQAVDQSKTGLLDTHPCDRQRIESARRENAPGVFHLAYPATVLFRDFPQLCKDVTGDFYRAVLGRAFSVSQVHPLEELLARQGKDIAADKAVGRYFQGCFHVLRPLTLPSLELTAERDPRAAAAQLQEARQRMLDAKPAYDRAYTLFDQADTRILETYRAWALLRAKLKFKPGDFGVPLTTFQACHDARSKASFQQGRCHAELLPLEQAAAERLSAAMELLAAPQVEAKIKQAAQHRQECEKMASALSTVRMQLAPALELRNEQAVLETLLPRVEGNEQNEELIGAITDQMRMIRTRVLTIREALWNVEYPFDHAKGAMSIGQYIVPEVPESDDLGKILEAGRSILEVLPALYAKIIGRLVAAAELVEQALGLPRLEEPAPAVTPEQSTSPPAW